MACVNAIKYYLENVYSLSAHHVTLFPLGFRHTFPIRSIIPKHTVKNIFLKLVRLINLQKTPTLICEDSLLTAV